VPERRLRLQRSGLTAQNPTGSFAVHLPLSLRAESVDNKATIVLDRGAGGEYDVIS
jgi:hypothetical protein